MCSLINKQLLLTAYAYLFIMEQQKVQGGSEALQVELTATADANVGEDGKTMLFEKGKEATTGGKRRLNFTTKGWTASSMSVGAFKIAEPEVNKFKEDYREVWWEHSGYGEGWSFGYPGITGHCARVSVDPKRDPNRRPRIAKVEAVKLETDCKMSGSQIMACVVRFCLWDDYKFADVLELEDQAKKRDTTKHYHVKVEGSQKTDDLLYSEQIFVRNEKLGFYETFGFVPRQISDSHFFTLHQALKDSVVEPGCTTGESSINQDVLCELRYLRCFWELHSKDLLKWEMTQSTHPQVKSARSIEELQQDLTENLTLKRVVPQLVDKADVNRWMELIFTKEKLNSTN